MEDRLSSGPSLGGLLTVPVVLVDDAVLGKVAPCMPPGSGGLGGLPLLLAAAAGSDLGGDGPVLGDDGFGLGGVDRAAVGVADDVGHAAVHDSPGPFGEVGGHDAEGAEVVLARSAICT